MLRKRALLPTLFILVTSSLVIGQQLTATEILDKSIQYHDPENQWPTLKAKLYFNETRPSGPDRKSEVEMDNSTGWFKLNRNDEQIHGAKMDSCFVISGDITCDRALVMRNYYLYLWGLPMKLKDGGTDLQDKYTEEMVDGQACYVLNVPYEKDVWYFYIRKDNFALMAYKFYKDEAAGKGEFIPTDGEIEFGTMKFPNNRTWYQLPGDKILGTDILMQVEEWSGLK